MESALKSYVSSRIFSRAGLRKTVGFNVLMSGLLYVNALSGNVHQPQVNILGKDLRKSSDLRHSGADRSNTRALSSLARSTTAFVSSSPGMSRGVNERISSNENRLSLVYKTGKKALSAASSSSVGYPNPSPLKEGSRVPFCEWPIRRYDAATDSFVWDKLNSESIFINRRIVIFALPGAFTPTCSSMHLPTYSKLYEKIIEAGKLHDIYCLSVNDTFVMNEWAKASGIDLKQTSNVVKLIPDGNFQFTEKMGMLVDKSNIGFGKRSWRYSMLVDNGIIQKVFIEDGIQNNTQQDPYQNSDAATMLAYLTSK